MADHDMVEHAHAREGRTVRSVASCDWDEDGAPDIGGPDVDYFLIGGSLIVNNQLDQCLLNLMSNAAKFTRDGEIILRARRERLVRALALREKPR